MDSRELCNGYKADKASMLYITEIAQCWTVAQHLSQLFDYMTMYVAMERAEREHGGVTVREYFNPRLRVWII